MPSVRLSVNVNKYALVRNSRGRDAPSLRWAVDTCVLAGAHGITVHPRLDERHVRMNDVPVLGAHLRERHPGVEYNIECEDAPQLIDMVLRVRPDQCTLVPVRPGEITSDHGFVEGDVERIAPTVERLKNAGIRVSLFVDCIPREVRALKATGADRVELYTGPYALAWTTSEEESRRAEVFESAQAACEEGLGVNAGHDLDRHNLAGLRGLHGLREVSIGHAQIVRALEVGTTQSVAELLEALGY